MSTMIAIHAIWDKSAPGRLILWAESSELAEAAFTKAQPKTKNSSSIHPYAADQKQLMGAMRKILPEQKTWNMDSENFTVHLPTSPSIQKSKNIPIASKDLVFDSSDCLINANTLFLSPWTVPAITLPPGNAFDALQSLPENPPHSIAFGSSLRFFREASKFVLELLAKQSYAPTAHETGKGTIQMTWNVLLAHDACEKILLLSESMPPLCRSYSLQGETTSLQEPKELVQSYLDQTVDALVRRTMSTSSSSSHSSGSKTSKKAPLSGQLLNSFSSETSEIAASGVKMDNFSTQLNSWLGRLWLSDPNAPFRTCFRLDPPDTDADAEENNGHSASSAWILSFHLQAKEDKSLLVSAEDIWERHSNTSLFLKHRFENPEERLLADLGRASGIYPLLDNHLNTSHPAKIKMKGDEAYKFLREYAPLLEQSGFGILLPSWWKKPGANLSVRLVLKPKAKKEAKTSSGLMGMDSVVAFDWKIALGDDEIPLEEFENLANMKIPLVNVRGKWVEFRPEDIEKAIQFLKRRQSGGEMELGEALRMGLGQEISEIGLPVSSIEGQGYIKDFLGKLSNTSKVLEIGVPDTFVGSLRPYQHKGVSWLAFLSQFRLGACLADDMGLGKTIQLIALMLHERSGGKSPKEHSPTLLVCPMSIVENWHKEIQRFGPSIKVMIHHGTERLSGRGFEKEAKKHDIVITTYSLVHRDEKHLSTIKWGRIVLDEAQNIKNSTTKQTQAIKRLDSGKKIALTGTPVENRLSELWSIMDFINPGYLGKKETFRKNFGIPIEKYRDSGQAGKLRQLIGPFVLRRLKTDKDIIKDLPEKMEMKVFCNLTREQATLYEATVREMLLKIKNSEGIERKGLILSTIMKLKQVCNHPAQFLHDNSSLDARSGKLERLEDMIEEAISEGDKTLVFTQFSEMGKMLKKHLENRLNCEILFLHGGTPKKKRDAMIQRFQGDESGPHARVFILSLKAGGVGLNLMAANRVFHYDRWWNPAVENQATDRAYRIGQKKNVLVHKFVCAGTLEERIDQLIEQKKELAESIVGTSEAWITEMSTEQLKDLFKLSRDAVGE